MRAESGVDPAALRDARRRAGLTQHEVARLVGVAGGERISRWELGTSVPRPELLARLGEVLRVAINDLLTSAEEPDLRRLRLSAGLSARTVAARAHMAAPTYIRWEAGGIERKPARADLTALARALGVSVDELAAALDRSGARSKDRA